MNASINRDIELRMPSYVYMHGEFLGYLSTSCWYLDCLGMSDFLAPILHVMEDESESFWCFASLMERLRGNFNRDQNGMHAQLLGLSKLVELLDPSLHNYFRQNDCLNYIFCFHWVLIQFKRHLKTWILDRKLVKRTVMASVYGVTFIVAHQQILKILQKKGHIIDDTLLYDVNCDYVYFVYTQYLKYYMWDCVNSIFRIEL
ncbi:hypothetical protein QYE76_034301 [Lolium multiflorum]|uniref:Rab-GAP TBC domain-containing protein n=1 Tax=Lolium multiflorum TaxID=4521 RepID=A0AAD8QX40_LOLMU|nr:hypothetical protein QYE76_034301 [Lolium multiflorum]